ncbi:MAG: hypothetical protein J5643_07660 [Lachnospiraceae bacterium]|nr:hypothetical protein [Lachnospiraceae bacterium]
MSKKKKWIIIGAVAAVLTIYAVVFVCFLLKGGDEKNPLDEDTEEEEYEQGPEGRFVSADGRSAVEIKGDIAVLSGMTWNDRWVDMVSKRAALAEYSKVKKLKNVEDDDELSRIHAEALAFYMADISKIDMNAEWNVEWSGMADNEYYRSGTFTLKTDRYKDREGGITRILIVVEYDPGNKTLEFEGTEFRKE